MASEEKEEQKNAWEKVEEKFTRYVHALCDGSRPALLPPNHLQLINLKS
jgi:hypothetical protein